MAPNAYHCAGNGLEPGMTTSESYYVVKVISSFSQLQNISEAWDSLLIHAESNSVFLTWEWLYAWSECFLNSERELFILCVYHSGELVGIAPYYIQKLRHKFLTLRVINFLGSPETGSDYLDVIIRKGQEKTVAEAIYAFLFGEAREDWDELRLTNLLAESLFLLHFVNHVEANGKFVEIQRCSIMPRVKLPTNVDTYFALLSANRRSRFRRDMRRLTKEHTTEHITYRALNLDKGLERFFKLYAAKSDYKGTKLHTFFKKLSAVNNAKQWVQVDILCASGTDIAGLLHLRYADKLSMLLMAVDKTFNRKLSTGNLFVGMCIAKAIEDGMNYYDFLKGGEDYKFHWTTEKRASLSITLDQHHLASIISTVARLLKYAIKAIVR